MSRYSATVREVMGPATVARSANSTPASIHSYGNRMLLSVMWVSVIDASAGTCYASEGARACRTATTRNCTRKRPRRRSALDTLTVLERLGSEQSTPGSCMPKCSASKPRRTSEQPLDGPVGLQQDERLLMRRYGDAAVQKSAVRFRTGWMARPASVGVESSSNQTTRPSGPPRVPHRAGQCVQPFPTVAAGRLQVVGSALRTCQATNFQP
jgi:hypothetical protein